MILRFIPFLLFILNSTLVLAQPANDNCEDALPIPDVTNWCSEIEAYTNIGATPSGYGPATCFNGTLNDVWFSFVAIATDVTIIINGNSGQGAGGTMLLPRAALYTGSCGGTINQLECGSSTTIHIVELYQGGLTPGQTYLIRVTCFAPLGGTFELCVNNYNSPAIPTSDCPTASILCDKSPFVVQSVIGAGNDQSELDDALCFSNGSTVNNESNSSWFTWVCETSGTLTFTLTPNNPADDIDFVLYELPNGVGDCTGKKVERCMASGEFVIPSRCMGPTGLSGGETDVSEPAGCDIPSQSNFLAPLQMVAGRTYALGINNFTSTGNGFSVEFGGTGTFRGPDADFNTFPPKPSYCIAEPISFQDASTFILGSVVNWTWYFGLDATPSTATGAGFHSVKYGSAGTKTVALVIETNLGCQVTYLEQIEIETCCEDYNAMNVQSTIGQLDCFGDADGFVDLTVTSITTVGFNWDTGSIMPDLTNLSAGSYTVTITNEATCDTVLTYEITSPPLIEGNPIITKPTCNGGQDGAIQLQTSGGVPPYQYDWQDGMGFTTNPLRGNLPIGLYFVTIKDANDCEVTLAIDVNELVLELNPAIQAYTEPSCFGFSDGSISISIINGLGPYEYNFNNTGWTTSNSTTGLAAGTYFVEVRDANNCLGYFTFDIGQPDPLAVLLEGRNISCFGANDGEILATPSGGTAPYSYQWSVPQSGDGASNLPPGTYTVTVTDDRGCTITENITLSEPPELFLLPEAVNNVICYGEANGALSVLGAGGTPGYMYSLDGGPFQMANAFGGLKADDYLLTVMDEEGCTATLNVTVNQPPPLLVDAGPDVTIELGYNTGLSATISPAFTPVSITWSPDSTLNCGTCANVVAGPVNTTTYTVQIVDSSGCISSDKVTVVVLKIRDIYIPNAFSPDANGINDYFTVYGGVAAESVLVLRIFNRWGGLIYEGTNFPLNSELDGWDGTFKGDYLNPDVFAFYALVLFIDGEEIIYKGDIQLIR
jgi:gliding motility-associated-like protein